jgi:hypothetical protein
MTGSSQLERGYRRMLACYPTAFRRENEEEILAVLRQPARTTSVNLPSSSLRKRGRHAPARASGHVLRNSK